MLFLVLAGVVVMLGLLAGFFAYVAANDRTPDALLNVVSGLSTAFLVAAFAGTLLSGLFGLAPAWRWGSLLGVATAALPVAFVGGLNLNDARRSAPGETAPEVRALLAAESHLLQTVEPHSSFADLEPFRAAWSNRRVVALGESTHGTAEFFRLKHRLVEFLVMEMGFRHFAMETHPERHGPYLNDHIQGGESSPAAVLYWPWRTKEYMALLQWMREYNESRGPEERIVFHGIDPQDGDRDRGMADNVTALLESVPGEKVIVWAANSHVRGALDAMGQHLKERFGDHVYLLGLEFHQGAFTSRMRTAQVYEAGPFPPSYYTHALAALPGSIRFLDFGSMSHRPELRTWLAEERFSNHFFELYALTRWSRRARRVREPWLNLFDGIVFIEESSPATPLP